MKPPVPHALMLFLAFLPACSTAETGSSKAAVATTPVSAAPASPPPAKAPPPPVASTAFDPAAPTQGPANVLLNPGFEQGDAGWHIMDKSPNWGMFEITDAMARSGKRSAHLPVHWTTGNPGRAALVFGVLQEPTRPDFPDTLSGWYRVENWDRGGAKTDLYLQAVVIVWGDPRAGSLVNPQAPASDLKNYQIRYYLAGLQEPPFILSNARRKFLAKGDPKTGEWIHFETDVRKDFEELWGVVPANYEFVRVLFEGRWDNKPEGQGVHADVYYDDLFFGYGKPVSK